MPHHAPQEDLTPWALHWFRRDLRLAGNPALQWAYKQFNGSVVGLFCFDSAFLAREDFSVNRFAFFLQSLRALRDELREAGSDLLVLDVGPDSAFAQVFSKLSNNLPKVVSFNRDYEPFARQRDVRISALLKKHYNIEMHDTRDHLVFEPNEISRSDNAGYYQVYTPFAKRWFAALDSASGQERIQAQKSSLQYLNLRLQNKSMAKIFQLSWDTLLGRQTSLVDKLQEYIDQNQKLVSVPIPEAGSLAAYRTLIEFSKSKLPRYKTQRDFPAATGTSQLSIYFKNGSLTTSQAIAALSLNAKDLKDTAGSTTFLKELVWREFYYHILFHCPEVEHQSFLTQYRNLAWENDAQHFEAWKAGLTGYPIVDAGMRELLSTGRMHNRVRMIVASFLTKDLLIDWRWGERYFMQQLLDGDLAPNNGGWQWAASTGCDAQPYFRIFNPELQSKKFDPDGVYIKHFVPELAKLDTKSLHSIDAAKPITYPTPIVEHKLQRMRALDLYRS